MNWMKSTHRLGSIFFLGFASGLPLALVGSTLQAWLTTAGVSVVVIGSFSLVQQPYVYKFLWAPFIDRFSLPFLDRRRGWILLMQCALAAGFIIMAMINPKINPTLMWVAAFIVAFFSATQDISYDAYRTDLLTDEERGLGSSFMVVGYRIALLLAGAFALGFASYYSFRAAYLLMAAVMLIGIITSLLAPKLRSEQSPTTIVSAFIEPVQEFIARPRWMLILLLIILYKFGDAFVVSLSTTFLLRGLHFSLIDVAFVNKTGAMLAVIVGGFIGGIIMTRMRLFSALLFFGILQTLTNLGYMILAIVGKNFAVMTAAIVAEHFCSGMSTIAFLALLMALCDHRYTAAQFAVFSAIDSIGRVFIGPVSGYMAEHLGWVQFYFWTFIAAIPALIVLLFLKKYIDTLSTNKMTTS